MAMIYLINKTDPKHLALVKAEMATLGAPTIRAFDAGDHWVALEGSHRITAAVDLGLPVIIEELDFEDIRYRAMSEFDSYDGSDNVEDHAVCALPAIEVEDIEVK